jgi:hypothetical protein
VQKAPKFARDHTADVLLMSAGEEKKSLGLSQCANADNPERVKVGYFSFWCRLVESRGTNKYEYGQLIFQAFVPS